MRECTTFAAHAQELSMRYPNEEVRSLRSRRPYGLYFSKSFNDLWKRYADAEQASSVPHGDNISKKSCSFHHAHTMSTRLNAIKTKQTRSHLLRAVFFFSIADLSFFMLICINHSTCQLQSMLILIRPLGYEFEIFLSPYGEIKQIRDIDQEPNRARYRDRYEREDG